MKLNWNANGYVYTISSWLATRLNQHVRGRGNTYLRPILILRAHEMVRAELERLLLLAGRVTQSRHLGPESLRPQDGKMSQSSDA